MTGGWFLVPIPGPGDLSHPLVRPRGCRLWWLTWLENGWPIEIVDLPTQNGDLNQFAMFVNTRGYGIFEWVVFNPSFSIQVYLVVGRERLGCPYSRQIFPIQWGAGWSYLEYPNHLIGVVCENGSPTQINVKTISQSMFGWFGGPSVSVSRFPPSEAGIFFEWTPSTTFEDGAGGCSGRIPYKS